MVVAASIVGVSALPASPVVAFSTPSGTYKGSKSLLGQTINAVVTVDDTTHMDLKLTGAATVDCKQEVYSYDGGSHVTLPGLNTAGDCVHDTLAGASVPIKIKSIEYSQSGDYVDIKAGVSFYSVTLTLSKTQLGLDAVAAADAEHLRWFDEFVAYHGRTYTGAERASRFEIFKASLASVRIRSALTRVGRLTALRVTRCVSLLRCTWEHTPLWHTPHCAALWQPHVGGYAHAQC